MSLDALLTDAVAVQRRSSTKDGSGGQAAGGSYVTVPELSSLPCLIQPLTGKAMRSAGERQVILTHHVYLDAPYDVRRGDRLYEAAKSRYFTVHGFEDMGGQRRVWRVECVEKT